MDKTEERPKRDSQFNLFVKIHIKFPLDRIKEKKPQAVNVFIVLLVVLHPKIKEDFPKRLLKAKQ